MDFLLGVFLGAIIARVFLNWLILEDIKEELEEIHIILSKKTKGQI